MITKKYARLINEDYLGLNLTNNVSFFPTDYILRCVDGDFENKQIRLKELGDEILIGSDSQCNFNILGDEIFPKHSKLNYIKDSIYYCIEDLGSVTGTFKKVNFFDDGIEITDTTLFRIFQNEFILEKNDNIFTLKFTAGSLMGTTKLIEVDYIDIGKKDCFYEITMSCIENHILRVQKLNNNKLFVQYLTSDVTNEGFYYKLGQNQRALLRPGDCIKIGGNTFRLIIHNWAFIQDIGNKSHQEDTCTIIDDLRLFDHIIVPFYAVYDGHGINNGDNCSKFLKRVFHENLRNIIKFKNIKNSENFFYDFCKVVQEVVVFTDIQYLEKEKNISHLQGSTCICLFFIGNKIISCNLGDSLSILVKNNDCVYLSRDLKPERDKERERIMTKNGHISNNGRLLSMISVSRAFGDWKLKDPKKLFSIEFEEYLLGNRAEFRIYEYHPEEDQFLILCSDGLFQYHKQNFVFDLISKYLKEEKEGSTSLKNAINVLDNVRIELINNLYGLNNNENIDADNMTLILVHLQNYEVV